LLTLLAIIVLDGWIGFAARVIMALDVLLLLVALGVLFFRARPPGRYNLRRMARLIETRCNLADNPLINAVDLRHQTSGSFSESLRTCVIDLGDALAAKLSPWCVVDRARLQKSLAVMIIAVSVWIGLHAAMPSLISAVLLRMAAPGAHHPPFTTMQFHVQVQRARVEATISGHKLTAEADLVMLDTDGKTALHLPMTRIAARSFRLSILPTQDARSFYIYTPAGRSKTYALPPSATATKTSAADQSFSTTRGEGRGQGRTDRPAPDALEEVPASSHTTQALQTQSHLTDPRALGVMGGVPLKYRELAHNYLRRIALDSSGRTIP